MTLILSGHSRMIGNILNFTPMKCIAPRRMSDSKLAHQKNFTSGKFLASSLHPKKDKPNIPIKLGKPKGQKVVLSQGTKWGFESAEAISSLSVKGLTDFGTNKNGTIRDVTTGRIKYFWVPIPIWELLLRSKNIWAMSMNCKT